MHNHKFIKVLENAFKFYTGLALAVFLLQIVGLIIYSINVWPKIQNSLSDLITSFIIITVFLILIRSCIWIWIYFFGARAFSILYHQDEAPQIFDGLISKLRTLTKLLVISCITELCFVPIIFMSDKLLPFSITGLWLGIIDLSLIFFPQAFGISAIILAFLTHQYGSLLKERSQMREDLELTI
jgi:hypothetical protein